MANYTEAVLRHASFVIQTQNGEAAAMQPFINRHIKTIRKWFRQGELSKFTLQRLEQQLKILTKDISATNQDLISTVNSDMAEVAINEIAFEQKLLNTAFVTDFVSPAKNQVLAAVIDQPFNGLVLKKHMDKWDRQTKSIVNTTIKDGYVAGLSNQQIQKKVLGDLVTSKNKPPFFKGGVINSKVRADIRTIVRSATNHTSNTARGEVWKENNDVIARVQWLSTFDNRTTTICISLHGQSWTLAELHPVPPAHMNCRSSLIAITADGVDPTEERSAKVGIAGGEDKKDRARKPRSASSKKARTTGAVVNADTPFDKFILSQPVWYQEDLLGKQRALLLRQGKLDVRSLFDWKRNNVRTVQGLKRVSQKPLSDVRPDPLKEITENHIEPIRKNNKNLKLLNKNKSDLNKRYKSEAKKAQDLIGLVNLGKATEKQLLEQEQKVNNIVDEIQSSFKEIDAASAIVKDDFANLKRAIISHQNISEEQLDKAIDKLNFRRVPRDREKIEKVLRDVMRFTGLKGSRGEIPLLTVQRSSDRAFADDINNILNVGKGVVPKTIWHEYGHFIEFNSGDIKKDANQFINDTRKTTRLEWLGKPYAMSERAFKNEWISPYVGKIYPDGFTEVTSMGVERFVTVQSMMSFFNNDERHFLKIIEWLLKE